jgi:C-terminal processing protease CtpA/Prc
MKLKLASSDVIMAIDGVKTLGLSAEAISALMSSRAEHERSLTIQKSRMKGRFPSSAFKACEGVALHKGEFMTRWGFR